MITVTIIIIIALSRRFQAPLILSERTHGKRETITQEITKTHYRLSPMETVTVPVATGGTRWGGRENALIVGRPVALFGMYVTHRYYHSREREEGGHGANHNPAEFAAKTRRRIDVRTEVHK